LPPAESESHPLYEHSFTADQAERRFEAGGFSRVSDLRRAAKGAWRARAVRDGRQVNVILNFEGTIAIEGTIEIE
jgi:hypothetical protein